VYELDFRDAYVEPGAGTRLYQIQTTEIAFYLWKNGLNSHFGTGKIRGYNSRDMPDALAVGMVPDEYKHEPISKGIDTVRKKKPKELAVITECCTGCAGSPACVEYCPIEACMFWVPDEDHSPFGRIQVDPILCIGCKKCVSKGPDGCFLDGCPWDAIAMVETTEIEKEVGVMPF
jgi:ferredoxin